MDSFPESHTGLLTSSVYYSHAPPAEEVPVRLYWEVARRSFQRYTTYRGATIAGVFTNTVFGFIQAYVLIAMFAERLGDIRGFDVADTVTFAFVAQGFLMMIGAFPDRELGQRIRTGDIVSDLYRPVDFQAYWLAQDLGKSVFYAIFRGVPPVVIGAILLSGRFVFPSEMGTWSAFFAATSLAILVSFAFRFIMSMSAFWILDVRGMSMLTSLIVLFFSGSIVPLYLFPDWLQPVVDVLPFAAMLQLPIEVYLGKHGGAPLWGVLGFQLVWLAALLLVGRAIIVFATRRLVVQGG
jgi:ABC-2 type transport system permease protein